MEFALTRKAGELPVGCLPCWKWGNKPVSLAGSICVKLSSRDFGVEHATEKESTFIMKMRPWLLTVAAISALALLTTPAQAGGRKKHYYRGCNGGYGYYQRGWNGGYGYRYYRPYYRAYHRPVYYYPAPCYQPVYYSPAPVFFFGFGFR
jgi:hypothetical protein